MEARFSKGVNRLKSAEASRGTGFLVLLVPAFLMVFNAVVESGGPSAFLLGPNINTKPVSKMFLDGKKIPGREEFFLIHGII